MSGFLNMLLAHGYTAEQGTATGAYLCALLLMGYTPEIEYSRDTGMYQVIVLNFNSTIGRIGTVHDSNLANVLLKALGAVREHLGAEEFTRQLHALSPGAFLNDN